MPLMGEEGASCTAERSRDEGIPASNKAGASHPSGLSNPSRSACASSPTSLRIQSSRSTRSGPPA
jgi:hypothetical protein